MSNFVHFTLYFAADMLLTAMLAALLFYFLIFGPEKKQVTHAAIALAVGFATFENVCYLTENGASQFSFLLNRGISAGALHILCGILIGCGMAYVFYHCWLRLTGAIGLPVPASFCTPAITCSSLRMVPGSTSGMRSRRF